MRLFKIACFFIVTTIILAGCGLVGSSGGDNDDDGNETEPTEYDLTVSASPSEGGSVIPSSISFTGDTTITVEARSNEGWAFTKWTGDQEASENPSEFTLSENTELTANFQDQRSVYTMELKATNTTDTLTLHFGQAEGATDDFDEEMDEEWPPMDPPSGELNASFTIGDLTLSDDFRDKFDTEVEWTMNYQVGSGEDLKLEWNLTDDTKINGNLILTDESSSFEVDMLSESTHTISSSTSGTLLIQYNRD